MMSYPALRGRASCFFHQARSALQGYGGFGVHGREFPAHRRYSKEFIALTLKAFAITAPRRGEVLESL